MKHSFFSRGLHHFKDWWHAPATRKDRFLGAVVGGIGSFWIGVLGRIALGPTPVSGTDLGLFALGAVAVGVALGIAFPKVTTCLLFPFTAIGGGPSA